MLYEVITVLVALGYDHAKLNALAEEFPADIFSAVVNWLTNLHTIYNLLAEISLGTGRIAEIVGALKRYTYMDQAPVQTVDVHQGLDSTLVIFHSKLKRGITVRREYATDLPPIHAHGSALNQVWTNIIDNAIHAMAGRGTLVLRTRQDGRITSYNVCYTKLLRAMKALGVASMSVVNIGANRPKPSASTPTKIPAV